MRYRLCFSGQKYPLALKKQSWQGDLPCFPPGCLSTLLLWLRRGKPDHQLDPGGTFRKAACLGTSAGLEDVSLFMAMCLFAVMDFLNSHLQRGKNPYPGRMLRLPGSLKAEC